MFSGGSSASPESQESQVAQSGQAQGYDRGYAQQREMNNKPCEFEWQQFIQW